MLLTNFKVVGLSLVALPLVILGHGMISATPAEAAGCGGVSICGGTGNGGGGGSKPPAGGGNSGSGSGGGSNNGGGNGGGTVSAPDPWLFTMREKGSNVVQSNCKVRNDGKKALAVDFYYSKNFKVTTGKKPSANWYFYGNSSGGNITWARDKRVGKKCLYPSRTITKTLKCPITVYADVVRTRPNSKTLGTSSASTGYKAGSLNYNACLNASANVFIKQKIDNYGYYKVSTWQKQQNVTFEIATTKNDVTGVKAAPKAISHTPVTTTSKRQAMTGSLDCKNGWRTPGVLLPANQYNDSMCEGNVASSYKCFAAPVKVDGRAFGSSGQFMRNGKPLAVQFGQTVKGNNITVKSTKVKIGRSGTPWKSSLPTNSNSLEIRGTKYGKGILKNSKETGWLNGNKPVYVSGYDASNPGSKTNLTQSLEWTGTKKVKSVDINSINVTTGKVSTTTRTITVPTSGTCSQSYGMEFIRVIGSAT